MLEASETYSNKSNEASLECLSPPFNGCGTDKIPYMRKEIRKWQKREGGAEGGEQHLHFFARVQVCKKGKERRAAKACERAEERGRAMGAGTAGEGGGARE